MLYTEITIKAGHLEQMILWGAVCVKINFITNGHLENTVGIYESSGHLHES